VNRVFVPYNCTIQLQFYPYNPENRKVLFHTPLPKGKQKELLMFSYIISLLSETLKIEKA
jgi:hypothetical protein